MLPKLWDMVLFGRFLIQGILGALLFPGVVLGENWPGFRGPSRQGLSSETNLPRHWNADSNIVWKVEIPGESWSSPIVWENQIFITTATENGQNCRILSVDRISGRILWNKEIFEQVPRRKEARNTYATPTPVTDGQRIYAVFGDGSFVAVNPDGTIAWKNREYKFYGQHGLGTSPILYGELLIMARDGSSEGEDKKLGWQKPWDQSYLLALDTKTGKERWKGRRGLSRISHITPNIWQNNGRVQVISGAGDVVQGFDLQTGKLIWSSDNIGEGVVPSIVLGKDVAFTASGWGGRESIKAFRLTGEGQLKESNLVWEQRKGMPRVPSMIYVSPYLFAIHDGGVATCMKESDGEIVWQERVGGNFSASPVAAEGRIYFLSDEGETAVVAAAPAFRIVARNGLKEKVQASPAISQGEFFIRTEKNLYCIGTRARNTLKSL